MATVTMRKGDRFADIFDSPETVEQARKDGYHECTDEELEARGLFTKATEKFESGEKKRGGRKKAGTAESGEEPAGTPVEE